MGQNTQHNSQNSENQTVPPNKSVPTEKDGGMKGPTPSDARKGSSTTTPGKA